MKKKIVRKHHHHSHERPIRWLPIDSRFITPIFSFGQVKGMARIFLEIEITLSILIVIGTLLVASMKVVEAVVK